MKPNRKLNWIRATDSKNAELLKVLQLRMAEYYASSNHYYEDIDFTAKAWIEDECYRDIVSRLECCSSIAEIGCGSANILKHHPQLRGRYTGCDFSPSLMEKNRARFPEARFQGIEDANVIPIATCSVDAVFSVFVIEHTIYPHLFLDECCRILKPGGLFILRCPNFLSVGRMTSQRAGFSHPNGREKLMKGRVIDAVLTGWDRKVSIPRRCAQIRKEIGGGYGFWLNAAPTCFVDPFTPDVDAIYLTYDKEMMSYLGGKVAFDDPSSLLSGRHPIYLVGRKLGRS